MVIARPSPTSPVRLEEYHLAKRHRFAAASWSPRRTLALALLLITSSLLPATALAQQACELSLQAASDLYDQGRFRAAREAIRECLATQPRRAERVQAYALLAKIDLVVDDLVAAEATLKRLLDTDPEYEPTLFDPPRFVRLVAKVKSGRTAPVVTSVSKSKESLAEAPATVVVITGGEIERRGYLDLEAVLHDLPGFDMARFYGIPYANFYQRGYRQEDTNRTLLLIDGVEDNDLASSSVFLSRQFPLSNIDRIEVIYGPASTMYGANAFAGVINIITKEPEQVVREGRGFGYDTRLTGGSWQTRSFDTVVAGQTGNGVFSWSLTARRYESDEYDLSDYDFWDYDPSYLDAVTYGNLNVSDPDRVQAILAQYPQEAITPYYDIVRNEAGEAIALTLTAAGIARARQLDRSAFDQIVNGHPIEYSNPTEDWLVYAKMRTANLVFGMQLYSRGEGANSQVTDWITAGGANGTFWTIEHAFMYMKYSRRYLEDRLTLTMFNRYKRHEIDDRSTGQTLLRNYFFGNLGTTDLLEGNEPYWQRLYFYRSNNQLRSEISLFYDHSEKFNLIGGMELRYSSVGAQNIASGVPPASETGTISPIIGGNQISSRDIGAYVQASYRPWEPLKLVAGARLDNNRIRDTGGYGSVFNSRLAAVYSWRKMVFKAIYSEAFQDAPNFQKFETSTARLLANPTLAPEQVSNFELSIGWSPSEELAFQLVGYRAAYQGIVQEVAGVPCPPELGCVTTRQFQNVGRLDLQGLQAEGRWTPKAFRLLANYTYNDPFNPDLGVRVGDIASHRLNLLGETSVWRERIDLSLRVNGVFGRKTGPGTTVDRNTYSKIDDYVVAHLAVTYRDLLPAVLPGIDLQLAVNNLFDTEYFGPGYRNGFPFAPRFPQPERSYFLSLRINR